MRVAMVSTRYLPYLGGVERHVHEVATRLAKHSVDLSVLTTDVTGENPPVEEIEGVVVRRFRAWPKHRDYYLSPELLLALARDPFDLVHVQGVHGVVSPLALAVAQHRRLPTVLTFHTGGHSSRLRTLVRTPQWTVERQVLRRVKLIAVCRFEAALFGRRLGIPATQIPVIRNGADPLPVADHPAALTGDPLLLSVGRLERYKGHHRAIAAMPRLLSRAPHARLAVVGTGPYESALRSQVLQLGLSESVSFVSFGPEERAGLGALVRSSDAVVLLSEYEANPVAVMEALGLGIDVLVADTTGLTELGDDGLAAVVPIDATADDTALAMLATATANRWADGPPVLPTWDGCTDEILRTYHEILGDHR